MAWMVFDDRDEAGRRLAAALAPFRGGEVVVLGLPRGGVPVAAVVARSLHVPLDVIVVRKVGVPGAPELAMAAIGEGGVLVLNESVLRGSGLTLDDVERAASRERTELARRLSRYRGGRPPVPLAGRIAIVVDDGVATGATARAACRVARARGARRVVVAVPVAAPQAVQSLRRVADDVVCLETPRGLGAVGAAYRDFTQVDDDEVVSLLAGARRSTRPPATSP